MSEESLRKQLYGSFKNRAMMYWHIYQVLEKEIGEQNKVDDPLKKAKV